MGFREGLKNLARNVRAGLGFGQTEKVEEEVKEGLFLSARALSLDLSIYLKLSSTHTYIHTHSRTHTRTHVLIF
jgi:hypothetical protein